MLELGHLRPLATVPWALLEAPGILVVVGVATEDTGARLCTHHGPNAADSNGQIPTVRTCANLQPYSLRSVGSAVTHIRRHCPYYVQHRYISPCVGASRLPRYTVAEASTSRIRLMVSLGCFACLSIMLTAVPPCRALSLRLLPRASIGLCFDAP